MSAMLIPRRGRDLVGPRFWLEIYVHRLGGVSRLWHLR